jgi:hypothetical protein
MITNPESPGYKKAVQRKVREAVKQSHEEQEKEQAKEDAVLSFLREEVSLTQRYPEDSEQAQALKQIVEGKPIRGFEKAFTPEFYLRQFLFMGLSAQNEGVRLNALEAAAKLQGYMGTGVVRPTQVRANFINIEMDKADYRVKSEHKEESDPSTGDRSVGPDYGRDVSSNPEATPVPPAGEQT